VKLTDDHISRTRLAQIARDPSLEKLQSSFEKRHFEDCRICWEELKTITHDNFLAEMLKWRGESA
jgi:hypothetical protein